MKKSTYLIVLTATLAFGACSKAENIPSKPSEIAVEVVQEAAEPIAADPLKRGRVLYTRCKACHTLEEGGKHRVGPNLWNIAGAKAGTKEGFAYSTTMSESEVVWTDEALAAYIENPKKYMPGNRMSFAGLRKPEDQVAVIEYLKAQTTPQ